MIIVMQTRGVMERVRTPKILRPTHIVCHTKEQAKRLADADFGQGHEIAVLYHGLPEGPNVIGMVRDWVERESGIVREGMAYAGVDDNISAVTRVIDEYYHEDRIDDPDRDDYNHPVTGDALVDVLKDLEFEMSMPTPHQAFYGGFGWVENPMFRRIKWQSHGYVKAKLYVRVVDDVRWCWNPAIQCMFDHAMSFKQIERHGRIMVNRFVYCDHPQYEPGGIGSHAERMPYRAPTCDFLYDHFGDLIAPHKDDRDKPVVRLRSQKTIDEWRASRGHQG